MLFGVLGWVLLGWLGGRFDSSEELSREGAARLVCSLF